MKLFILILKFIFITQLFVLPAQTHTSIFQSINYVDSVTLKASFDTIKGYTGNLDIYFYKWHFFTPYHIPDKFIDSNYRDTTVTVWLNINKPKDFMNQSFTTTYDRSFRVVNFSFSSCYYCNELPYNYSIKYDSHNRIVTISETIKSGNSFKFYYNALGDMNKVEYIHQNKLSKLITLIKTF